MPIVPDEIIRSKRKSIAIVIDSFGRLIVRAPFHCNEARIFTFLQEKEGWILRKKEERRGVGICLPPENLQGYSFLLLGKQCKIVVADTEQIGFDKKTWTIYLPKEKSQVYLVKWLKENAKRVLTALTAETAKRMGVTYASVSVTSARGRWGSCTGKDDIHYSFRLLYAPQEVIEYVVVHELSHVRHKNHSKNFWNEVARYEPNWKNKRGWLKKHGVLLEIF